MYSKLYLLCASLTLNTVSALHFNTPTSLASIVHSFNRSYNASGSGFRTSISPLKTSNEVQYGCSALQYGQGLDVVSCLDAIAQLDRTSKAQQSWGPRLNFQDFDLEFPQAYWSSDLTCCVIPLLAPGINYAHASIAEVAAGASLVLRECANKEPHKGGMAKDISPDHGLGVVLAKYVPPPNVGCFGTTGAASIEKSCLDMLNNMKASANPKVFSGEASPRSPVVKLPFFVESADKKCVLTINTSGASDIETWERIWENASLVTAHCIRSRKAGSVTGLGKDGRLSVSVTRGFLEAADQDATA